LKKGGVLLKFYHAKGYELSRPLDVHCPAWIRSEEKGVRRTSRNSTWTAAPWPDLAGDVGFDAPGHHRAWEENGERENLEASSMEGSGKAATARWRPRAWLGGVELAAAMA